MDHSIKQWAEAIAQRLSDEWDGKTSFPDDAIILKDVLTKVLSANPEECRRLIGTGVIEETYFEALD